MITLEKIGDAIKFTFSGNTHYLQDGTVEVPVNSLSLTIDDSGMATFRKSASNDIFISATYGELGMTKDELVSWYKDNMVGGGGGSSDITSGEVQSMIDESISGKQDTLIAGENITISGNVISAEGGSDINVVQTTGTSTTDVMSQDAVTTKLKTKLDNVRVDPKTPTSNYSQLNLYLEKEGSGSQSLFTYVKTINGKSITSQNNDNLEGFSLIETSAITTSVTSGSTDSEIPTAKAVYDALGGGGGTSYSAGTGIDITNDVISVTGKVDTSTYNTYTAATDTALSGKQDTLIAGSGITISGNVISSEGGNNVVELTQAEYDALVSGGTVDPTAFYIITDATPIDLSNYYTSAQTNSAINAAVSGKVDTSTFNTYSGSVDTALSGKQDTLSAGTGIDITNDVISVSGVVMSSAVTSAVISGSTDAVTSGGVYDQLGGMKIVKLTESEYAALVTKDSNTLYVVVPDA